MGRLGLGDEVLEWEDYDFNDDMVDCFSKEINKITWREFDRYVQTQCSDSFATFLYKNSGRTHSRVNTSNTTHSRFEKPRSSIEPFSLPSLITVFVALERCLVHTLQLRHSLSDN